jgi:nitrogen fixation/metabolism regulation signal transduction histidine kinase
MADGSNCRNSPISPRIILVVDDDLAVRTSLRRLLKQAGYPARTVPGPAEALAAVPRLIQLDMNFSVAAAAQPASLTLTNDGAPLSPEVSQRLFTPFFSTKPSGRGIGLVLVRDILLAHGFAFRLEN